MKRVGKLGPPQVEEVWPALRQWSLGIPTLLSECAFNGGDGSASLWVSAGFLSHAWQGVEDCLGSGSL